MQRLCTDFKVSSEEALVPDTPGGQAGGLLTLVGRGHSCFTSWLARKIALKKGSSVNSLKTVSGQTSKSGVPQPTAHIRETEQCWANSPIQT